MKTTLLLAGSTVLALAASAWLKDPRAARAQGTGPAPAASAAATSTRPLTDDPLAAYRKRLLDLAFTAASALPLHPHQKTRSLLQEEVVDACLALGQLASARGYADRIDNWRRGSACADLARCLVERGASDGARALLAIAQEEADALDLQLANELEEEGAVESAQDWQRDQIRTKIAQALVLHGEHEKAAALEAGAVESEAGRVGATRARTATVEDFEVLMVELEAAIGGLSFESTRFALEACLELYDRFYADAERRARAEAALRGGSKKLPQDVRFALLTRASEIALAHEDRAKALEILQEADAIVRGVCAGGTWIPEHEIPLRAALAALRHRVGDRAGARAELEQAAARYEATQADIVEIYRAGALRPLAEAALVLDDAPAALAFYRRALEEGARNANARPRTEDLVATCLSLARHEVEPDEALWQRILQIRAELKAPW